jgi:hypothetical protein
MHKSKGLAVPVIRPTRCMAVDFQPHINRRERSKPHRIGKAREVPKSLIARILFLAPQLYVPRTAEHRARSRSASRQNVVLFSRRRPLIGRLRFSETSTSRATEKQRPVLELPLRPFQNRPVTRRYCRLLRQCWASAPRC